MSYSNVIPQIYREAGPLGFYHGYCITWLREVVPFGLYFGTYEYMKTKLKVSEQERTFRAYMSKALAGGIAGLVVWSIGYPFDIVKTEIQREKKRQRMFAVFNRMRREYGMQVFFKGLAPCLLRAFPVNACAFIVYDCIVDLLR